MGTKLLEKKMDKRYDKSKMARILAAIDLGFRKIGEIVKFTRIPQNEVKDLVKIGIHKKFINYSGLELGNIAGKVYVYYTTLRGDHELRIHSLETQVHILDAKVKDCQNEIEFLKGSVEGSYQAMLKVTE